MRLRCTHFGSPVSTPLQYVCGTRVVLLPAVVPAIVPAVRPAAGFRETHHNHNTCSGFPYNNKAVRGLVALTSVRSSPILFDTSVVARGDRLAAVVLAVEFAETRCTNHTCSRFLSHDGSFLDAWLRSDASRVSTLSDVSAVTGRPLPTGPLRFEVVETHRPMNHTDCVMLCIYNGLSPLSSSFFLFLLHCTWTYLLLHKSL